MSNAKHTTGPWKVEKELTAKSWQWLIAMDAGERGRGIGIAETLPTIGGGAELANAVLIAAAPELLEACKNLLTLTQILANDEYDDEALVEFEVFSEITKSTRRLALSDELAKARAAIAKATGAESSAAQPVEGGEA